jgi:hypothetical protein
MHCDADKLPAHDQPPGEVEVFPAWFETPGWVIVEEENATRPIEQRQPKEFGPIDWRLGAGAEGELANGQEPMASIQAHESEDLPAFLLQSTDQKLSRNLRLIEPFGGLHLGLRKSLTEFDRRQEGGHLGRSKAGTCRQLAKIKPRNPGQAPGVCEQAVGLVYCVSTPSSGADQHSQELGIRQRASTKFEQTLARPLRRLHFADTLCHVVLHGVFTPCVGGNWTENTTIRHPEFRISFSDNSYYPRLELPGYGNSSQEGALQLDFGG